MSNGINCESSPSARGLAWVLYGYAFFLPLSIAVAQPLGYVAVIGGLLACLQRARWLNRGMHPLYWPMIAFVGVAIISAFFSVRPAVSVAKLPRLLLMGLVPIIGAMPDEGDDRSMSRRLAVAFAAGCAVRAIYHVGLVLSRVPAGVSPFDLGNMRDPQMYLAAWFLLMGLYAYGDAGLRRLWTGAGLLSVAVGLLLNFKRGAWLAFLTALLVVIGAARKWRWFVIVVLMALCIWICPWSRERLAQSRREFSTKFGGRYTLWMEVAPAMLKEFPQGMGYAASRNSDFVRYAPRVQPGLHHLHNNVLQIALELGVAGLAAWTWWVVVTLACAYRNYRCLRNEGSDQAAISLGVLGAFVGLLGNGVFEYNFGDSEILMLWFLLSGLVVRGTFTTGHGAAGSEAHS